MLSLENTYKSISTFLTKVISSGVSILKLLIQSNFSLNLASHKDNQKCVILGNGPSLGKSLIEYEKELQETPLICVNLFALTKDYETLKPKYYVMHDPGLWFSEGDLTKKIGAAIKEKTKWPITIYVPYKARKSKFIQDLESQFVTVSFYNYSIFKGFQSLANYLFKKNLAMPQCQNVLVASLFLAINIGFKNIYFIGADHTWHENLIVNQDNILCIKDVHYYDEGTEIRHKPFYKGLHVKDTFKVAEIFETWAKVFKGYGVISEYSKYTNTHIFNASEVSFIDAFERRKIS
jgi:hypothetical protein